jgi:hypothetical protein
MAHMICGTVLIEMLSYLQIQMLMVLEIKGRRRTITHRIMARNLGIIASSLAIKRFKIYRQSAKDLAEKMENLI